MFYKQRQKRVSFLNILKNGGIGAMPTDTIFGLVGSALKPETVERIYKVRGRDPKKPLIVLIYSLEDLRRFGVVLSQNQKDFLKKVWPGKVSVILSRAGKNFTYIHRGTNSIAFRMPKKKNLLNILRKTGPLAAPSANPEGLPPARNIKEAKKYFGEQVDFYLGGKVSGQSSTLIRLNGGFIEIVREGAWKIPKNFKYDVE